MLGESSIEFVKFPDIQCGEAELAQIDRSLTPWGQSLRRHFLALARWGRLPGYRWWRERVWLGMKPRERRITRLIAWATLIEFPLFVAAIQMFFR